MPSLLPLVYLLVAAYALVLIYLVVNQRKLMYEPDRNIASPEEYGLSGFEDITLHNSHGLRLQAWFKNAEPGFPTVVYYHGNAYHIGGRASILGALANKGFGVMAVSYRGYGKSEGSPTEQGLYDDARAALSFLNNRGIPLDHTLIYGESLGTGVAVQMASEHKVAGLILQAAYMSVVGRAAEMYFYVPVRLLISDRYESINKIANVRSPLLLFHGERDETIPLRHGQKLFEAANEPKKAFFMPNVSHNDFDSDVISAHVLDFAKTHGLIQDAHH